MSKYTKFIITICLQVAVIAAIVVFKLAILGQGTEILLKIRPVDPRDPIRGDYVTFTYDISTVSSYSVGNSNIRNGDTVYVVLRQSGNYWVVRSAQTVRPHENEVFIKGRVISGGFVGTMSDNSSFRVSTPVTPRSNLTIEYGIEEYFIPEGTGQNMRFGTNAAARVVVDDNGNAVLNGLIIDGNPWP